MLFDFARIRDCNKKYCDTLMKELNFQLIGTGSSRRTYLSPSKKYVLKFPTCVWGIDMNVSEHNIWHKFKNNSDQDGTFYAPCRLIGGLVLMMWAVTQSYGDSEGDDDARFRGFIPMPTDEMPAWVIELDCCQAGTLSNGKVVAYDYGE